MLNDGIDDLDSFDTLESLDVIPTLLINYYSQNLMGISSSKPMEIPESVKTFVDTTIKSKKVVVFSKSYCPYCTKAKRVLEKYPIVAGQYLAIEIENRDDCSHIQEYLRQLTGASSVRLSWRHVRHEIN